MSENKDLGIYEGCYAELRDGSVVGPVKLSSEDLGWPWYINECAPCWSDEGFIWRKSKPDTQDIIRVIDPANMVSVPLSDRPEAPQGFVVTIPPHVTKAAMDAGIKAEPAYEQFVNAVLQAGLAAMGDRVVPVGLQDVEMDALCEEISTGLYGNKGFLERPEAAQQHIRNVADRVISYMADKRIPKNESENGIQDSEKAKGGLSDLHGVIVNVLRDDPQVRDITSLASALVEAINKASGLCVDARPPAFSIAPDLIAIALDEGRLKSQSSGIDTRSFQIKAISDLIKSEAAKYRPRAAPAAIPSVETIDKAIRAAVREWRETDSGTAFTPPVAYLAKKVHAVIKEEIALNKLP